MLAVHITQAVVAYNRIISVLSELGDSFAARVRCFSSNPFGNTGSTGSTNQYIVDVKNLLIHIGKGFFDDTNLNHFAKRPVSYWSYKLCRI
jgi:hypothetical protein